MASFARAAGIPSVVPGRRSSECMDWLPPMSIGRMAPPPTALGRPPTFRPLFRCRVVPADTSDVEATPEASPSVRRAAPRGWLAAACAALWISIVAAGPATATGRTRALPVDWPQFHMDASHRGVNVSETAISVATAARLHVLWKAKTNKEIDDSSPSLAGGIVYVGSDDGSLYAFDGLTGAKLWAASTGGIVESSPAVAGGRVFVGSDSKKLFAFDALTGARLWSFAVGDRISQSSPTVANGIVYVGSLDGYLYAVNASTGALVWRSPAIWKVRRAPAVANGLVYVGTDKARLFAFDAATGTMKWEATLGGMVRDTPSVVNGVVYVGADDYRLHAFDASTGGLKWKTAALPNLGIVRSSPAVANGLVYIDTGETSPMGSHAYAFDIANGVQVWKHTLADYSVVSPAVANGVLITASNDGQAYAFDAATGTKLWSSQYGTMGRGLTSSPAVANGIVYIGSRDGYLYAFTV